MNGLFGRYLWLLSENHWAVSTLCLHSILRRRNDNIPIVGKSDRLPDAPEIGVDPTYNPFAKKGAYSRDSYIDRFEKDNISNWEKLFPETRKETSRESGANIISPSPKESSCRLKTDIYPVPLNPGFC